MAWVEKRSSGFLVRWRDGLGRKRQRLFRDEFGARAFADAMTAGRSAPTVERSLTLSEYLAKTLDAADDIRESTRYHYVSMVRKHIGPALGHLDLGRVETDDVRQFLATMRHAGYSSGYQSVARHVLARTFRLALSEGLVGRSPLAAVPPHKQEARSEVQPLEVDEVEALASAILPRYRAAVLTMAYAGLRVGEVGALTIKNLNLRTRELCVRATVARAGGRLIVVAPKTSAGRRTVSLPQFLAQELRRHVDLFCLAPDGRVFHTPGLNQHRDVFGLLHTGSIHKPFARARAATRLPHVHPHALRHTYAALLIREGAHPKVIQTLMGHASITVTLDLYGHLFPGFGQELADQLHELQQGQQECASWLASGDSSPRRT
jgi:integrase